MNIFVRTNEIDESETSSVSLSGPGVDWFTVRLKVNVFFCVEEELCFRSKCRLKFVVFPDDFTIFPHNLHFASFSLNLVKCFHISDIFSK